MSGVEEGRGAVRISLLNLAPLFVGLLGVAVFDDPRLLKAAAVTAAGLSS